MSKRVFRDSYFCHVLLYFFLYFSMAVFSSILAVYLTGLGLSASEMSLIVSSAGLFSFVVTPIVGYLSDRTGKPKLISCVMLGLLAVSGIIFSMCRSVWALFILNGVIMSCLNTVMPVSERMAGSSRFRYGTLRVWGTLGYAAAAQAAGVLLDISPALIFYAMFISAIISIVGFIFVSDKSPAEAKDEPEEKPGPKDLLKNPKFLLFLVIGLLFQGCSYVNMTYAPLLLSALDVPTAAVGTVISVSTLTEIPLIVFSNKFMDKFSSKVLLGFCFGLITAQFVFYGLSRSAAVTVAVMVLFKAVASTMYMMIILKVVRNLLSREFTTTGLALVHSVNNVASLIMQNLGGILTDSTDVFTLYLIMSALTALGLVLALCLKIQNSEKVFS